MGLATAPVEVRDPVQLVFVIDTSGSMEPYLPAVKDALSTLVGSLEPGQDRIAAVTYSDTATPLLEPTDVGDRATILGAIDRLSTSGSTSLADGMVVGYDLATDLVTATDDPTVNTRVVLLSDGIANTGVTSGDEILQLIADGRGSGVELLTVGFGLGGFNDPLMEQLANEGDGLAVYVDTPQQAREVFTEDLAATLQTVAADARAQVTFDPETVGAYRLIGYEANAVADEDFDNDTVDAAEIGAGHTVTALYEVTFTTDAELDAKAADVALRWLDPDSGEPTEIAKTIYVSDVVVPWESASAGLRLAGNAAAWAEILRLSPHATGVARQDFAVEARRIADATDDAALDEWATVVETWAAR